MADTENVQRINVAAGVAWSTLVLAAMIGASIWAWDVVPDGAKVPTHWNARGEVNGYWSKEDGLAFAPAVAALITLIFAALPLLGSRRRELAQVSGLYHALWAVMMTVFAVVHAKIVSTAVGAPLPVSMLAVVGLAVVVATALAAASAHYARRNG